jgi:endonuclease/exonuclease/phosphatase (EEP) superfamily protein YafD
MVRNVLAVILVVVAAAILLVAAWPQLFGLQDAPIIAQIVALRGLDIAVAIVVVLVLLVIMIWWRRGRRFLVLLTALILVFCLASIGILAVRGFGGSVSTAHGASDVTVLDWNTKGSKPSPATIAALVLSEHADVIALPETSQATGIAVAEILKAAGRPMWVFSGAQGGTFQAHATTLLISAALGRYKVDSSVGDTAVTSSLVARPDSGQGPTIVAVHAVSPRPGEMRNWRADLAFLAQACTGQDVIMAGDFNSTLDGLSAHRAVKGAQFAQCLDAGLAAHTASVGSWPTSLPALLGAQIDHVMYTPAWKTVSAHVITTEDNAGSDHRPVVATLAPAS